VVQKWVCPKKRRLCQHDNAYAFIKKYQTVKPLNPVVMEEILTTPNVPVTCKWHILQIYDDVGFLPPSVIFEIFKLRNFFHDQISTKILKEVDFSTEPVYTELVKCSSEIPAEFKISLFKIDKYRAAECENVLVTKSVKILYNLMEVDFFQLASAKWSWQEMAELCLEQLINIESLKVLTFIVKSSNSDKIFEMIKNHILAERTTLLAAISFYEATKSTFANLLLSLAEKSELSVEFIRLILCCYQCSLSASDQILFKAYKVATENVDVSELRPFLFGGRA